MSFMISLVSILNPHGRHCEISKVLLRKEKVPFKINYAARIMAINTNYFKGIILKMIIYFRIFLYVYIIQCLQILKYIQCKIAVLYVVVFYKLHRIWHYFVKVPLFNAKFRCKSTNKKHFQNYSTRLSKAYISKYLPSQYTVPAPQLLLGFVIFQLI